MPKSKEFEYESLQDTQTIRQYLQSLIDGFENGRITLNSEDERIILHPKSLLRFTIKAQTKDDKSRLYIAISWKNSSKDAGKENISISS